MPKIVKMTKVTSIKAGLGSTVLSDGSILNPEPYSAVNIYLDDGRKVQVERPLTIEKIQAAVVVPDKVPEEIDGIREGQQIWCEAQEAV